MEKLMMQRLCIEMNQKASFLYESGQWSDCSFVLGSEPNKDIIDAHKLILAMASPVFESLLYGEKAIKNFPFPIVDVQPKTFRTLMEYIYTNTLTIGSIDDACQLSYTAKKYMMSCLMKECINYLWNHVNPENVCQVYEFTQLVNANMLMQKCLKIFSTETKRVINSKSFVNAEMSTVIRIFSMNNLNVDSELDFVVAAERYLKCHGKDYVEQRICLLKPYISNGEVSIVNNEGSGENRIKVVNRQAIDEESDRETGTVSLQQMRSALEKVRFLTVTAKDFAECPALNSVISQTESLGLLMNIVSDRANIPMPIGFTTSRVARNRTTEYETDTSETRPEATFRFTVQNFANLTDVVYSPPCYVRRLPWQIMAGPKETDSKKAPQKSFCFVVLCNILNESPDWSCNATVELRLVPSKYEIPTVSKTLTRTFNRDENQGGFANYLDWSEMIKPETGYISPRGAVDLELHIKADPPQGV